MHSSPAPDHFLLAFLLQVPTYITLIVVYKMMLLFNTAAKVTEMFDVFHEHYI